jgi:hypothetical protein
VQAKQVGLGRRPLGVLKRIQSNKIVEEKQMANPFSGAGGGSNFRTTGEAKKTFVGARAHKTLWEVSGVGHHHGGGTTSHKNIIELGWAAHKVDAANAFAKMHAHKYKKLDIHSIIKL